jgi:pSer/pThr/pTyr-binding forkhead associated (FHA) protein
MGLHFKIHGSYGTVAGSALDKVVEGEKIVAGRAENVDLVLPDISVSKEHFIIESDEDGWCLRDVSKSGTRLNGKTLDSNQTYRLQARDVIEAGAFRMVFHGQKEDPWADDTRLVAEDLVRGLSDAKSAPTAPVLRVENGPATGSEMLIEENKKLRLGRGKEAELFVDDARISRQHAIIQRQGDEVWFIDAKSKNGSRIDGKQVAEPVMLLDGSIIELGRVRLRMIETKKYNQNWLAFADTFQSNSRMSLVSIALMVSVGLLACSLIILMV